MNAAHLPDTPDRSPLVDDFLFDTDTMLLYAPAGGYKSMVAINLAVAVASGGTFMGKQAHKGRVLFVDGELSEYSFKQRFELFGRSGNLDILSECFQPAGELHLLPAIQLEQMTAPAPVVSKGGRRTIGRAEQPGGWQAEILTLVQRNSYKLVVFDNVRTLTVDTNENDARDVAALNTLVKRLRYLGCAVLVIHHTRKAKDEDGAAVFAGSSNLLTVYNTAVCIETPCNGVISFKVDKDRENSIGDYFKETHWTLDSAPGAGFRETNAHDAVYMEMGLLVEKLWRGQFKTQGELVTAARNKHGLRFSGSKHGDAIGGLHALLAGEAVVNADFASFHSDVKRALAAAKEGKSFHPNDKEDF